MARFTTGEAVALELSVARIPSRLGAFLLDLFLQIAVLVALLLVAQGGFGRFIGDSDARTAEFTVIAVVVLVGYPVAWETLWRGRTPGKAALGLRVVRVDGGPIDFRHALVRGLCAAIVDFWGLGMFGTVGMLTSLCSPQARRVGDVLAGTVVVHANPRVPAPAMALSPPWLSAWAAQLDPSALPDQLAMQVRSYLMRFRELTPATQHDLGRALVTEVCRALDTPLPGNYPPLQVLGAVIAERQRREIRTVWSAAQQYQYRHAGTRVRHA
jgi:uncharacterized RDD family membrane protein YckC